MSYIFRVKFPKRGTKVKATHIYNRFSVAAQIWTDIYMSLRICRRGLLDLDLILDPGPVYYFVCTELNACFRS